MTYEQSRSMTPRTLEEALEQAFWKWAGKGCLGAGVPETWTAVTNIAKDWLSTKAAANAVTDAAVIEELTLLEAWVRKGDYERDDARDEIARAIHNRIAARRSAR